MKTNRRNFISTAAVAAGMAVVPSCAKSNQQFSDQYTDYSKLDEALKTPVLKRELFSDPVIIESVELLLLKNNCMYRVRSTDGAEGISAGHPFIAEVSYPMVPKVLARHFEGKDARDLDQLILSGPIPTKRSPAVVWS